MSNGEPKTVRELYFFCKGEFEDIKTRLKLVFWIGGFAGTLFSGIVIMIFKVAKWIK